ncbi:MAG: nucleoside hydrolase [Caldilineaceae bacterium]
MAFPLIVDTDMAFDDWMAVTYLLAEPLVKLKAITIAATGETHSRFGVQNALRLLTLADSPFVPVAAGRTSPLQGSHQFPWFIRRMMDFRLGLTLPRPQYKAAGKTAVELIIEQLRSAAEPLTILALGPLTNLAEVILAEPGLVKQMARIYCMGGALRVPGNLAELNRRLNNPHAEWNIYIDPYAAAVLFAAGAPLTLVPLDVTNQHALTDAFYERCAKTRSTPAADFVYRILRRMQPARRFGDIYFWDPLAAVVAVHPEIAQFEERKLTVIQTEGNECGRVIEHREGHCVQVCTRVDQVAFEQIFLNTLNAKTATV